jgi:glycosyltransferase involved in cell wall biosynthesis
MNVFVAGTRGIPDIPGGVEKHCQELYPRMAARGHEVSVCTRSCYVAEGRSEWQGVELINCFAPRKKSLEAIAHTFLALVRARRRRPDVVHLHAVGPSLLTPLARLMGLKVVVTNHGPDYDRKKWGAVGRLALRLGEKLGGRFANEVIVISSTIADIVRKRCRRESHLIYNGVTLPQKSRDTPYLDALGAKAGTYVLAVARFVPEKGLHDLIKAFQTLGGEHRLIIAGDADHESSYSKHLRRLAAQDDRIILTGYINGERLNEVYSHAGLFVLPSYHEGLPIVLLEALSYDLPVLVSDIAANKEVELPAERYFRCGDVAELARKIQFLLHKGLPENERQSIRRLLEEKYNWDKIADQTVEIYRKAVAHV